MNTNTNTDHMDHSGNFFKENMQIQMINTNATGVDHIDTPEPYSRYTRTNT